MPPDRYIGWLHIGAAYRDGHRESKGGKSRGVRGSSEHRPGGRRKLPICIRWMHMVVAIVNIET
eukprot:2149844-Karenia_brevis.AAC.1